MSVPDSPFPFLLQTSSKDGIWWKGRTSVVVAHDGSNRFSLAGLGVEKKDVKFTIPHSGRINFLEYGMKNFFRLCNF